MRKKRTDLEHEEWASVRSESEVSHTLIIATSAVVVYRIRFLQSPPGLYFLFSLWRSTKFQGIFFSQLHSLVGGERRSWQIRQVSDGAQTGTSNKNSSDVNKTFRVVYQDWKILGSSICLRGERICWSSEECSVIGGKRRGRVQISRERRRRNVAIKSSIERISGFYCIGIGIIIGLCVSFYLY